MQLVQRQLHQHHKWVERRGRDEEEEGGRGRGFISDIFSIVSMIPLFVNYFSLISFLQSIDELILPFFSRVFSNIHKMKWRRYTVEREWVSTNDLFVGEECDKFVHWERKYESDGRIEYYWTIHSIPWWDEWWEEYCRIVNYRNGIGISSDSPSIASENREKCDEWRIN